MYSRPQQLLGDSFISSCHMKNRLRSLLPIAYLVSASVAYSADLPNILWISSEDHGPHLGCYGDEYATTPNIDAFAKKSLRYTHAISNAPVCAVARTTLISGMYAPSTGGQHMRSRVPSPEGLQFYPAYLQDAGYYTTNNSKQDYNLIDARMGWDESSSKAHWKNRPEGKPFFAIFNYTISHESQVRNKNPNPHHDPAKAPIPPYHPDTPESRSNWAQYYDRLTTIDELFQKTLDEVEEAGLMDDTIVMFFADHGSGMPRSKRYPGWSGLNVPVIVHVPEKFKHLAPADYVPGGASDRLIGFIDFAPSTLSIAGVEPPEYYQGEAFMGPHQTPDPEFSFGFRGRMDERPDFCRTILDGRYVYIRNYYRHLPHGQFVAYQQKTQTTNVWFQKYKDGDLNEAQSLFWKPHPHEELFDLRNDPHEINNLAGSAEHREELIRLRKLLDAKMAEIDDLGVWPEPMLREIVLDGKSPRDELSGLFQDKPLKNSPELKLVAPVRWNSDAWKSELNYGHPVRRYWTVVQLITKGGRHYRSVETDLEKMLSKEQGVLAVAAAECIGTHTRDASLRQKSIDLLYGYAKYPDNEFILAIHAFNAMEHLKDLGHKTPAGAASLTSTHETVPDWGRAYLPDLVDRYK